MWGSERGSAKSTTQKPDPDLSLFYPFLPRLLFPSKDFSRDITDHLEMIEAADFPISSRCTFVFKSRIILDF
jgi:hypothetical protein